MYQGSVQRSKPVVMRIGISPVEVSTVETRYVRIVHLSPSFHLQLALLY